MHIPQSSLLLEIQVSTFSKTNIHFCSIIMFKKIINLEKNHIDLYDRRKIWFFFKKFRSILLKLKKKKTKLIEKMSVEDDRITR